MKLSVKRFFLKTHKASKTSINILKAINMKMSSKVRWKKENIIIAQVRVLNPSKIIDEEKDVL